MIKLATKDDIPLILPLCKNFFDASDYAKEVSFDYEVALGTVTQLVKASVDTSLVLVAEDYSGMLGATVSNVPFASERIAVELAWWVNPSSRKSKTGLKLFSAFEWWAKNVANCNKIQMTSLFGTPEVERFLIRKGYKPFEIAYLKDL